MLLLPLCTPIFILVFYVFFPRVTAPACPVLFSTALNSWQRTFPSFPQKDSACSGRWSSRLSYCYPPLVFATNNSARDAETIHIPLVPFPPPCSSSTFRLVLITVLEELFPLQFLSLFRSLQRLSPTRLSVFFFQKGLFSQRDA